ncbi:hypothetical protein [Gracilimonas mengyeensis]|uniref:Lipocalin-like domain-containing protein n=1 Tax=Gracilimonas mengyeensis TaxID=1302730 RepID=A0A521CQE4_9BACT|nr:hypothetical protein [Gracilimonas mengyeensis]SMO61689.1 hypothetical protein SAMN06265219_10664 [Gracilimonas mengyeensis]
MRLISYSFFCSILLFSACSLKTNGDDSSTDINLEELTQHWVHSYEEEPQGSDVSVYRPHDYKEFPPSRFRMQYIFEADGYCTWFYLAPDDGHHFRPGKWQLDAQDHKVIIIEQDDEILRYRITELNKEVLRMQLLGKI